MSAHTPGPWTTSDGQVWRNEIRIADTSPRGVAPIAPRSERPANARLIAAAPDLLTALAALVERHDFKTLDRGIGTSTDAGRRWLAARAAIAKATGDSNAEAKRAFDGAKGAGR